LRVEEAEERLNREMDLGPQVEADHAQAQEELQRLRTRTAKTASRSSKSS
jgi:chromosome segregation protein